MSLVTPLGVNEDAVKQLVQNIGQAVGGGRFKISATFERAFHP